MHALRRPCYTYKLVARPPPAPQSTLSARECQRRRRVCSTCILAQCWASDIELMLCVSIRPPACRARAQQIKGKSMRGCDITQESDRGVEEGTLPEFTISASSPSTRRATSRSRCMARLMASLRPASLRRPRPATRCGGRYTRVSQSGEAAAIFKARDSFVNFVFTPLSVTHFNICIQSYYSRASPVRYAHG